MSMQKKLKSGFFGLFILVIGIIVGVMLVKQTTAFKNKAKGNIGKIYIICHKVDDIQEPWGEINVSAEELPKYLNAGDIFGKCPDDKK